MLYLCCFDRPFRHARHYLGFVDLDRAPAWVALPSRMAYHRSGQGSKLLRAAAKAGVTWKITRTWENGTRSDERRLKGHGNTRLCPNCSGEIAWTRGLILRGRNLSPGNGCGQREMPLTYISPTEYN